MKLLLELMLLVAKTWAYYVDAGRGRAFSPLVMLGLGLSCQRVLESGKGAMDWLSGRHHQAVVLLAQGRDFFGRR